MAKHTSKALTTTIRQPARSKQTDAARGAIGSGGRKMVSRTTGAKDAHVKAGKPIPMERIGTAGQPRSAGAQGYKYGKQGSKGGGTSAQSRGTGVGNKKGAPYKRRNTTGLPASR